MAILSTLEHLLYEIARPIAHFFHKWLYHPVDSAVETVHDCAEWVQDHPYTTCAVIGLGAYAHYKGWIKYHDKQVDVNVNIKTCVGGYRTSTSLWCGKRRYG